MIAEFPQDDERLGAIIRSTETFGEYTAAAEALRRYEPETGWYFVDLAERLDPLTQARASAAAWSRADDQLRVQEWLQQLSQEALSWIAWAHAGFPPSVRELAKASLEHSWPGVDWNLHVGGTSRLEVVEFYLSYLTEDDLVIPAGAIDFVAEVAASLSAHRTVEPQNGRGFRVTVGQDAPSRLLEILVEDGDLGRQVLLAGGGRLYSTKVIASLLARLPAPPSFFRELLGVLDFDDQPLLVVGAAARLAAERSELEAWVASLSLAELESLVYLEDALDTRVTVALAQRVQSAPS